MKNLNIADELQYGVIPIRVYMPLAFRPRPENCRILNVSAKQTEACKFMKFTRSLLEVVPFLNYLKPDINKKQRDSALQFDVASAEIKIRQSVKVLCIPDGIQCNFHE